MAKRDYYEVLGVAKSASGMTNLAMRALGVLPAVVVAVTHSLALATLAKGRISTLILVMVAWEISLASSLVALLAAVQAKARHAVVMLRRA